MGGGDLLYKEHYHYARAPIDRIVTGLCHIIVTHSTDEDDAVDAYYTNWGTETEFNVVSAADGGSNQTIFTVHTDHGLSNGDVVWIDGTTYSEGAWAVSGITGVQRTFTIQTPFVANETAGTVQIEGADDPPIGAQNSMPFNGNQTANPDRTGYGLRLGDQDTFLFNVSASCHCAAAIQTGSTTSTSGYEIDDSNTWYTSITHPKCQSFVRSTLLSRHNNAYGMASNFYKHGINTLDQPAQTFSAPTAGASNMMHNGIYSDENSLFEVDLATQTNNNYFSPVYDILFEAHHRFDITTNTKGGAPNLYRLDNHDTSFFNLLIKIKLYSFDKAGDRDLTTNAGTTVTGGTTVSHFRNRTNVYWQPFGETSEMKFAKTPYTS